MGYMTAGLLSGIGAAGSQVMDWRRKERMEEADRMFQKALQDERITAAEELDEKKYRRTRKDIEASGENLPEGWVMDAAGNFKDARPKATKSPFTFEKTESSKTLPDGTVVKEDHILKFNARDGSLVGTYRADGTPIDSANPSPKPGGPLSGKAVYDQAISEGASESQARMLYLQGVKNGRLKDDLSGIIKKKEDLEDDPNAAPSLIDRARETVTQWGLDQVAPDAHSGTQPGMQPGMQPNHHIRPDQGASGTVWRGVDRGLTTISDKFFSPPQPLAIQAGAPGAPRAPQPPDNGADIPPSMVPQNIPSPRNVQVSPKKDSLMNRGQDSAKIETYVSQVIDSGKLEKMNYRDLRQWVEENKEVLLRINRLDEVLELVDMIRKSG